jgi:RNA polymerase sigma-70 factor (ECF subfamily)
MNGQVQRTDSATIHTERVVPDAAGRAGEREALAAAYASHEATLYGFALRATRDHDAAEDAVAEAYDRLLREWRRGHHPENVGGWLMRVAANVIVSSHRRRAVADRWRALIGRRMRATADDPEALVVAREGRSELEARLATLAPDARTALLLAANGFSCTEIADAIGRSDGATRTLLCRSRMRMREILGADEVQG